MFSEKKTVILKTSIVASKCFSITNIEFKEKNDICAYEILIFVPSLLEPLSVEPN